ncbi:beta-lactamase family protein [Streptomyces sp. NBC_00006]|uniref:serine hydrolase domain-containing protein n=1 Tax=unclassified Streptomyces TaxID=2593676 RepID=UPI002251C233|nr:MULTISPECIES: serine hydrolase domain-containing protein [unclassified Streptomyces]MCX4830589.1 beta-lactamase family protein [Streptomyces sp. NBC_01016]MCX5530107.1 beta-lactamase family protein [Streptomyces sp. NBC_00006]
MTESTGLTEVLAPHVSKGPVPGAVGLVARGDRVEVAAVGHTDTEGGTPMARDSIFRIASITKPIVAAALMTLVEEGRIALDSPLSHWLPELAAPNVVRDPAGPIEDVVPAARPITVEDLLTFRAGWGFPSDFSLPAVQPLFALMDPHHPQRVPEPDTWLASLAGVPLLHQPGDVWLYNVGSDIQGVLISRMTGSSLPDFLAERIFEPLGMADTGFEVPAAKRDRFTSAYVPTADGGAELVDAPDGQWSSLPAFPSGAGGLVSTADDWLAFARMLLAGGGSVLSADSVRLMTTDHLTAEQRAASGLFTEGEGWGFGGSVDVTRTHPYNVPGRYGWVGGTGTAAHLTPTTGTVSVLMTQLAMSGPTPPQIMRDFWTYAAS